MKFFVKIMRNFPYSFYNLRDASSLAPDTSERGRDLEDPPAGPEDSEKPRVFDNNIIFAFHKFLTFKPDSTESDEDPLDILELKEDIEIEEESKSDVIFKGLKHYQDSKIKPEISSLLGLDERLAELKLGDSWENEKD